MKTQNVQLACKRMASGAQQRRRDGAEPLPARAATAVPPQRPARVAHPLDARVTYMYARTYSRPKGLSGAAAGALLKMSGMGALEAG